MPEVETLISEAVETAATEAPQWFPQRNILSGKLIEALETNASWVDLFGITGEVDVPDSEEPDEILQPLQRVKEVR